MKQISSSMTSTNSTHSSKNAHAENLGQCALRYLRNGDIKTAKVLFSAARRTGSAIGERYYGLFYLMEDVFNHSADRKAFRWLLSAARKGDTDSMAFVARCYAYGIGTEVDETKADEWMNKLKDADSSEAFITKFRDWLPMSC